MTQLFGHELLLAARYKKEAIKSLPAGRGGKVFLKEAGDALPVIIGWAKKNKHPVLAAQGLWRGGAHDYSGNAVLKEGLKECKRFSKVARDYPHLSFEFSIFCEHKLKTPYLKTVYQELMEIVHDIPNLTLVNTPMVGGDFLKAATVGVPADRFKNEVHGTANPNMNGLGAYNWACDGLHAVDCNIQALKDRHARASMIWLWVLQYNCKTSHLDPTPIPQRTVVPVGKQILSIDYLCSPKGATNLESKTLYKSHADQHHNTPDPREQKPVVLSPFKIDTFLEVVDSKGTVIGKVNRAGTYPDGRGTYRSPVWGFELFNKAFQNTGSPLCKLRGKKGNKVTNLGTVNPAFRENFYRTLTSQAEFYNDSETFIDDTDRLVDPDWV